MNQKNRFPTNRQALWPFLECELNFPDPAECNELDSLMSQDSIAKNKKRRSIVEGMLTRGRERILGALPQKMEGGKNESHTSHDEFLAEINTETCARMWFVLLSETYKNEEKLLREEMIKRGIDNPEELIADQVTGSMLISGIMPYLRWLHGSKSQTAVKERLEKWRGNIWKQYLERSEECLLPPNQEIPNELLTKEGILKIIQNIINVDSNLCELLSIYQMATGSDDGEAIQKISRFVLFEIRRMRKNDENVTLQQIYTTTYFCIYSFLSHQELKLTFPYYAVSHKRRDVKFQVEYVVGPAGMYADGSEFPETADMIRERAGYLQAVSDDIRTTLIPELLRNQSDAKKAFFAIHAEHFRNPDLAYQHRNHAKTEERTVRKIHPSYFQASVGQLRKISVTGQQHPHIEPRFLPALAQAFFGAIDQKIASLQTEDEKLNFITLCEMILMIAHFPFDGSGRTNEDFLVWLSKKLGLELSISESGKRSDGLVNKNINADYELKKKVLKRCLSALELELEATNYDDAKKLVSDTFGTIRGKVMLETLQMIEVSKILQKISEPSINPPVEGDDYYDEFTELKQILQQAFDITYKTTIHS